MKATRAAAWVQRPMTSRVPAIASITAAILAFTGEEATGAAKRLPFLFLKVRYAQNNNTAPSVTRMIKGESCWYDRSEGNRESI